MTAVNSVKTTCPYCGVGCGVIASVATDGSVQIKGDPDHPANFGRLCSKGAALGDTVSLEGRQLVPQVDGQSVNWPAALEHIAKRFSQIIEQHGPDAVAFYVSGQLLTEDYYVANKLMKGFIGSANIDTNSRLCMASSVAGHKRAFGSDTVPCSYEDLERAKLIVLVGSNTAWCHPVLYQRISKAKQDNPDLRVVVVDPRRTDTCELADMHLAIKAGSDTALFNGLLVYLAAHDESNDTFVSHHTEGLDAVLQQARRQLPDIQTVSRWCGVASDTVEAFYRWFAATERVVTVYSQGVNQWSFGTDKVNSIINCHLLTGRLGRPGMGPFSFTGQPNAMGGREVGGLANQLAAHIEIENAHLRPRVQQFWQAPRIADRAGHKAVQMFEAIGRGEIKAVWIMATNPVVSLPAADQVRAALRRCEFVVVSDCIANTDTMGFAHVRLPAQAWGEKDGSVTNSERRISRQRAFLPAAGESKPDWWILSEVAKRMGYAPQFDYTSAVEVFREHAALSGLENQGSRDFDISAWAALSDEAFHELIPTQWPITVAHPMGTKRMFTDGRFFTASGKAKFIAVEVKPPAIPTSAQFPLCLNSGRIRDQWHTMTRTGKSAKLSSHINEPLLWIHPHDAAQAALVDGGLAQVVSQWGDAITRVRISDDQRRGEVFLPMHWNDQFTQHGYADAVINPVVDPISGQPEFKHTPVKVQPFVVAWHGFLLSRRQLAMQEVDYWALSRGDGFWRYQLAGKTLPAQWEAWARRLLCCPDPGINWIEYHDRGAKRYRAARMQHNRVESCLFVAPTLLLPERGWLESLFVKDVLSDQERLGILTGKPAKAMIDPGAIVCACFQVGIHQITHAITQQGLTSVEAIGRVLRAGTNCGSCIPELQRCLTKPQADALQA
ncbi:MAG: molybdopterin-dependent oxidoreductase [Gammaproteobacteria bacterium]|nr:molybdopterin-dependent oxidoreductase [Gammaproteobacteria bacterium]